MIKPLVILASLASLATCIVAPVMFFLDTLSVAAFKTTFLVASILWFIFATLWSEQSKTETAPG